MNPIRSLAPDLVRGDMSTTWSYAVGPLLGALIGVAFGSVLKGKPTTSGAIAAQGEADPDDGCAISTDLDDDRLSAECPHAVRAATSGHRRRSNIGGGVPETAAGARQVPVVVASRTRSIRRVLDGTL